MRPTRFTLAAVLVARSAWGDDPAEEVPEVVVTGSRTERRLADSAAATEVISRQDIEASGAENVAGVLEEHSGLDVTRSNVSGGNVRIQGLDARYVLILVNGERVAGRVDGAIDLARFPVEDIQRIEILRGPSSALYGADAIGGVINLITRAPTRPWEADGHARYGSLNSVDASARGGMLRGPFTASLAGGYHRRDGFDLNPADAATDGSAFDAGNASGRVSWRASDALTLVATADWFMRHQRAVDSGPGGALYDRQNLTETLSASLSPTFTLGRDRRTRLRVSAWYTLYRDQFLRDQRGSDALDQYQQTQNHIANASAVLDHTLHPRHVLTVGAEGYFEHLTADRLRNGSGDRQRLAAFAQHQWTPLDRFMVVPGVRVDIDSQFGVAPTPKLQLRWDPLPALALRASYGWGFRAPSFQELLLVFQNPTAGYVIEGNADLQPERSRAVNVSAEWRPSRRVWLTVNLYRNDIDNLIEPIAETPANPADPTPYRYRNIASAWTMGAELSARLRPVDGVVVDLGYTLTTTRDLASDRPLEGRAMHRANAGLQLRHARTGLEFSSRAALIGPRPFYSVPGVTEAPPWLSLDLRAAWTWRRALTVFAGCDNVLDEGDSLTLRVQPRTFYAGVTLRR